MQTLLTRLTPFLANVFFIGVVIAFLANPIVQGYNFIKDETIAALILFAALYIVLALPYYLIAPIQSIKPTKGLLAMQGLHKFFRAFVSARTSTDALSAWGVQTHEEKTAILFILVKFIFLPLMLNFAFDHFYTIMPSTQAFLHQLSAATGIAAYNVFFFPYIISLIFFIDVIYFTFGYLFEHKSLGNTVRSVEPTFFGWSVTLLCYPPFNTMTGAVLGWYAADRVVLANQNWMFILNVAGVLLLAIYLWATLALGTKCSNLTNRGIVSRGPYGIVRHPAYIAKNLSWWITVLPTFNPIAYVGMAGWSLLYYLRALTEERHLLLDAEYREYIKEVKYKFIPGIW